jgi:ABC-type transport system substrate-binding protein
LRKILCPDKWILLVFLTLPVAFSQTPYELTESYGDQLHIGILVDKEFELNPFEISSPAQKEVTQLIFGYGLTKTPDKILNPPDLVERYLTKPSKKDSRVWRILLDRNINFHNDTNLRNKDVKFTFELIKRHGGFILNRKFDLSNIKSISVKGDLEVIFELNQPDENFGAKIADIPIIPQDYYQIPMQEGYKITSYQRPMGMGPFMYEYESGNVLNLKFHPHYYSGRPFLDNVRVYFFTDEQKLIDALVNREIDYIEFPDRTTMYRILELMADKIVAFNVPRPENKVYTILFNVNRFPLSDPDARRAILLAIDRAEIVERFMKDVGEVANTLIPATSPYYERSLYKDEYNPQAALQILMEGGWHLNRRSGILEKAGQPLSFKLYFTQNSFLEESLARLIKVDLAELNINVEPVPVLPAERENFIERSNYQAMFNAYSYNPNHLFDAFIEFYFQILGARQKVPNYKNRYLTRLFDLIKKQKKEDMHRNFYQRFQMFATKEIPAIFLFFDQRILIGVDKRFKEYRSVHQENRKFFYRLNPIENWFVPKEFQKRK